MANQLVFSLVGDSNVKRHMSPTNCRDSEMREAQVLVCTRRETFQQSLRSIRKESNVCVVSCVSNFLTASDDSSETLSIRVDPVLEDFSSIITSCQANPERRYLVSPPMYRQFPLWYRDGLPEVLARFSSASRSTQPSVANLGLLPSFPTPAFEADGVHLNAYSGYEFVLHLFDSSRKLIASLSSPDQVRESVATEATRLLEDRVVALEQDHRRLNRTVELKTAIDSELEDFRANERMLDCVVISGLSAIPGRLSGKDWYERAKQDSHTVLELVLGTGVDIVSVRNSTGMAPNAPTTYTVQLSSVEVASSIRTKFGSFFSGGRDNRPSSLSHISIQNSVTKATRIRISILKLLAKRYEGSNPGGKARVIGYQPRPLLRITPPETSKDRRVRSFNFIEAVQKFPTHFSESEVESITRRAYAGFPGKLRTLFVVLSDDFPGLGLRPRTKRAASPSTSSDDRRQRTDDAS